VAALPSGVPNLDLLLGGGVPAGNLMLLVGQAGSGKTTLALQSAFHTAAQGSVVCYVSTTSEPSGRLLEHARSYEFYDERVLGRRLFLISVYPLIEQGLDAVRAAMEREVREHGATLLILDGLTTISELEPDPRERRRFVYVLGAMLSTLGCTLLVTSSRTDATGSQGLAEFTMADVLVKLTQTVIGTRSERQLQVVKVRGQSPVLGIHTVSLDRLGLTIFPRFEALAYTGEIRAPRERTTTGVAEIDAMISGGLPAGSVTALAGSVGTGKTLLALQFLLEGARTGQKGLFVSARETRAELIDKARSFGYDLETPLADGSILFEYLPPVDLLIDRAMNIIAETLARGDCRRCVVDGIEQMMEAIAGESRRRTMMDVLAGLLRSRGVTAVIPVAVSQIVGPELDLEHTPMAALAQNLILLRYVEYRGELHRILSLLKVRDSDFDPSIRRYTITGSGLRVLARTDDADALLTGIARLASEARVKRSAEPEDE
jgi:circadian clock protein KaiC